MGHYFDYLPSSTSVKNLIHTHQMYQRNEFIAFDLGPEKNLQKYGQPSPRKYNLTQIGHRSIYVIHLENDVYVSEESLRALKNDIKGESLLN